jgi:hypothetical protein
MFHVAESFTFSLAKQVLNGKNGFGDQDDRTQCAFDLSPPSRLKARNPMLPKYRCPKVPTQVMAANMEQRQRLHPVRQGRGVR